MIQAETCALLGVVARLARACIHHRWIVIGTWLALLIGFNMVAGAIGPDYRTDFVLPDSESKEVQEQLEAADPTGGIHRPDRRSQRERLRRPRGPGRRWRRSSPT